MKCDDHGRGLEQPRPRSNLLRNGGVLAAAFAVIAGTALPIRTVDAAAGDLRTRLTDALGGKAWPISVKPFGPIKFIVYDCECKMGSFAFLDAESRIITQREAFSGLDYFIDHDRGMNAGHVRVLLSDTGETFLGASVLPGGGRRFTFANTISECEACAPFTALKFAFDFDKNGKFKAWRRLGYVSLAVAGTGKSPPGH